MAYLVESHFHTRCSSVCGKYYPEDSIPIYIQNGYSGVVVTDHYVEDYFKNCDDLNWTGKIDKWLEGYKRAKRFCNDTEFTVLLGAEIRFVGSCNDYLVYGMDDEFLYKNPYLNRMSVEEFSRLCYDNGFYFGQAHPFREECVPANPKYLMGVEVYNGHPNHLNNNNEALLFAEENNLIMTAGSDFHDTPQFCRAGIYFDEMPKNSKQLAEYILEGKIVGLKTSE
ncbi:MAG: PHP-associated domain-containing protein [bacterium]|nr:PHP-associated domain-containing protein [bacterium]